MLPHARALFRLRVVRCLLPLFSLAGKADALLTELKRSLKDATAALKHASKQLHITFDAQPAQAAAAASTAEAAAPSQQALDSLLGLLSKPQATQQLQAGLLQFVQLCAGVQGQLQRSTEQLALTSEAAAAAHTQLLQLQAMSNPYTAAVQQLQRQLHEQQHALDAQKQQQDELQHQVGVHTVLLLCMLHSRVEHVCDLLLLAESDWRQTWSKSNGQHACCTHVGSNHTRVSCPR
jgi:hypothetical protein